MQTTRKGKANTGMILGALALILVAFLVGGGKFTMPSQTASIASTTNGAAQVQSNQPIVLPVGYATTVQVSAINAITGASITDGDGWLYKSDNSAIAQDVSISAATTSLSTTAPNSLHGYAMIGNDANQGTDRGTERYYTKVPVDYDGQGYYQVHVAGQPNVPVFSETTSITWTKYSGGTANSSAVDVNLTVGTSVNTDLEAKMEVAAGTAFGNPDFTRPVGVCFNATTVGTYNGVTPTAYVEPFTTPKIYKGFNVLGCYVLDTPALIDTNGAVNGVVHPLNYRFGIKIDPASNPGDDQSIKLMPMDRTYYLDDNSVWQSGFGDDSDKGTSYDPGLNGAANPANFPLN